MNIAIYQIDPDRDENNVVFLNYENLERFQGPAALRSEIYDKVFEGEVECGTLEEVYQMFNLDHPDGYRGRSLSVSDVVEVVGEEKSTFHFCDSIGFREVDFDPDMTEPLKEKKIKVVLCEPGKVARVAEIGTELSDLQRVVGGLIEPYYPFEEQVSPRVHPIVRIVDGGKNFRLDKLGEYYELDSIKQRIQNNYRRKTPFPEVAEDTKAPYYQYKEKAKKASGLYALYLYYCYELHIIAHKPASVKKVSAFLREDVTKLDRYIAQADFLAKTGLETVEALSGYKAEKEKQAESLMQQRTGLKNELKRHIRKEDFQSAEATRARIAELTAELKTCRKDIVLCSDIADRSEQVRKNLEQIEQQKIERKERTENELLVRRSSRAGREDDTQRR